MTDVAAQLADILPRAWARETSYDPQGWSAENPAFGQCAVTACVVHDFLGGDIVWAEAELPDGGKVSHFFNRIAGRDVDYTRAQFPAGTHVPAGRPAAQGFATTRDYILSYPATRVRYAALASRVSALMKGAA
jgi:hypothetical protein